MRCFGILVVFACAFGVITAAVLEDAPSQPKESETIDGSDIRNESEEQDNFKSSESAKINSNEFSEESDTSTNDASDEVNSKTNESSNEDDTNTSSEVIDTKTSGSPNEVDTSSTHSSEEIDEKIDDIPVDVETDDSSEQLIGTTNSPVEVTDGVFPSQKVLGLNIGLYFVLEELRRKYTFTGQVPTALVVKVIVLSSKIEQAGGDIIPLNRNMMKVIPNVLPTSFKDAACSKA